MMRYTALLVALLCNLPAFATERSSAQVRAFKRTHICPSTGLYSQKCKNFVVDHVIPLCAGGADHPSNMQYQAIADAKRKDVEERRMCQQLRKQKIHADTKE